MVVEEGASARCSFLADTSDLPPRTPRQFAGRVEFDLHTNTNTAAPTSFLALYNNTQRQAQPTGALGIDVGHTFLSIVLRCATMAAAGADETGLTRVVAFGSNLFCQLRPDSLEEGKAAFAGATISIEDAASVVAVCTSQTVYRTHTGGIHVLGDGAQLLQDLLRALPNPSAAVFVGQDVFEVVLEHNTGACHFLDYEAQEALTVTCAAPVWKTAVADGRGRCMALDVDGCAYLFSSIAALRHATEASREATTLRELSRFVAYTYNQVKPAQADSSLPRFVAVAAGNAHFVLLADQAVRTEAPVWVYGDARFGAVPTHPDTDTALVGAIRAQLDTSPTADVTDGRLLQALPTFSRAEGFPCRIGAIAAGGRHSLALSEHGDVYGWGWNEHANLKPIAPCSSTEVPAWHRNMLADPTPLDMPELNGHDVCIANIAGAEGRTLAVSTDGTLLVAGCNQDGALGLDRAALGGVPRKPRFERSFSQIKSPFECVNGVQAHPGWTRRKVVSVHATALATFVTVDSSMDEARK
ncbi:hypothetical protein PaG_02385 [Moesziomyces aphidis]|uniref:Uncharacterized protein n=1 Tax=Moesziomyces aphidis TaxID=84754 RepID=W3VQW4_MOEAP|nr:hypothetical protein PaG_02385 [Moesziomyces aphidis]